MKCDHDLAVRKLLCARYTSNFVVMECIIIANAKWGQTRKSKENSCYSVPGNFNARKSRRNKNQCRSRNDIFSRRGSSTSGRSPSLISQNFSVIFFCDLSPSDIKILYRTMCRIVDTAYVFTYSLTTPKWALESFESYRERTSQLGVKYPSCNARGSIAYSNYKHLLNLIFHKESQTL